LLFLPVVVIVVIIEIEVVIVEVVLVEVVVVVVVVVALWHNYLIHGSTKLMILKLMGIISLLYNVAIKAHG